MNEDDKQKLVDAVIEEMKRNIEGKWSDWTAIWELLWKVDPDLLKGFLPEENNNEQE